MNIVICGAGEVGRYSAEVLSPLGHDVTIIDIDRDKLAQLEDVLDIRSMQGNATRADVLEEAGVGGCDLFIAATNIDEINLLAASVAKAVGAGKCIARVHHSAFFEKRGLDYAKQFGIDHLVCPEFSMAVAIASTLRSPGALVIENFARGQIEMQSLRIDPGSKAVGAALRDLKMPGAARLAAVERGGEAMLPDASTVLQGGDIVTLIGDSGEFPKVRKLFTSDRDSRVRIIVMGGTTQAVWLCRAVKERHFSVRLFEADRERAIELAGKLDWVTVLNADAMESDALKEERVEDADAFIAMTDDDERNILAAARAKRMGARSCVAVLQRMTYMHLLADIGIDHAFSPRATAAIEVQRLLEEGPVRSMASLAEGIAEVYEVRLPPGATNMIGRPLRSLDLPEHCLIAAVQRGDDVFIPGAGSELAGGDTLVVIGPAKAKRGLGRVFS